MRGVDGWPVVVGAVSAFGLAIAVLDRFLPDGVLRWVDHLLGGDEWRN